MRSFSFTYSAELVESNARRTESGGIYPVLRCLFPYFPLLPGCLRCSARNSSSVYPVRAASNIAKCSGNISPMNNSKVPEAACGLSGRPMLRKNNQELTVCSFHHQVPPLYCISSETVLPPSPVQLVEENTGVAVYPFIGMGTEIVTLCLNQVGSRIERAQAVEITSGAELMAGKATPLRAPSATTLRQDGKAACILMRKKSSNRRFGNPEPSCTHP